MGESEEEYVQKQQHPCKQEELNMNNFFFIGFNKRKLQKKNTYHFLSSDEKSSFPSIQAATQSSSHSADGVIDTTVPVTQGNLFLTSNFVG